MGSFLETYHKKSGYKISRLKVALATFEVTCQELFVFAICILECTGVR